MKKTVFWILLVLLLLLSACNVPERESGLLPAEAKNTAEEKTEETGERAAAEEEPEITPQTLEAMPGLKVPLLDDAQTEQPADDGEEPELPDPTCGEIPLLGDAPPTLFVVANGETFQFQSGNYSWTSPEQPDGTQMSVIACGIHPLDAVPEEETFVLIEPEGEMRFWFYVEPEKVTCRCWEERFWGKPEEGEPSCYAVEIENNTITPLDNGRYVYELDADWGDGCSASYIFFAMRDAIPSAE